MRRMKHHLEENYDAYKNVKEVKQQENRYSLLQIAKSQSEVRLKKYARYRREIGDYDDLY